MLLAEIVGTTGMYSTYPSLSLNRTGLSSDLRGAQRGGEFPIRSWTTSTLLESVRPGRRQRGTSTCSNRRLEVEGYPRGYLASQSCFDADSARCVPAPPLLSNVLPASTRNSAGPWRRNWGSKGAIILLRSCLSGLVDAPTATC